MKSCRGRILLILFWEMFKIALFVVGGGFAILAVADEVFARKLKWTREGEILDHLPVFQMVPGMIAGNTAVYVGEKMAGALGAAVALAGVVLPSLVIFSCVAVGYRLIPVENPHLAAAFVGLRSALTGIIGAMLVRGWCRSVRGVYGYLACAVSALLIGVYGCPAAEVILGAGVIGVAAALTRKYWNRPHGSSSVRSSFWMIPLLFLKYGCVAFGGGYVLVPMYLADFVGSAAPYLQLSGTEFADVMALTQMTPGPISVNCATFFGYRMGGIPGAVAATVALVIPGYVLLLVLLRSLDRFRENTGVQGFLAGIRPVTVALMLIALWAFASMSVWQWKASGDWEFDAVACALAVATGVLMYLKKVGVVKLVFGCALVSCVVRLVI